MNAKIIYRQRKRSLKCLARLEGIIMNARIVCRKRKRSLKRIGRAGRHYNERKNHMEQEEAFIEMPC